MIDPEFLRSSESPSGDGSVDPRNSGSNFSQLYSGVGWKEGIVGRGGKQLFVGDMANSQ